MIVLLIFLSQFDVQDKGKTPATIEAIATPSDDDHFADSPNVTIMLKKKIKQINLEIMGILYEANPTEEMLMRLSELKALACRYQISSNESLVITKFQ
jgi:hypothetical protein